MANQLKMAEIHAILMLRSRGWSFRRVARELGIHRETVAGYVRRAAAYAEANPAKPAIAPPGARPSEPPDGLPGPTPPGMANAPIGPSPPKPANAPPGSADRPGHLCAVPEAHLILPPAERAGPASGCEPYRAIILVKLDAGLSAVRIHQDLTAEHGASLSYHAVRRFVRKLRGARVPRFWSIPRVRIFGYRSASGRRLKR